MTMRVLILSQDENVYLPDAFAIVCRALGDRIVAIIALPAMSTHGGPVKGFLRHARFFGIANTVRMGWRVLRARSMSIIGKPGPGGPFYSIRGVAAAFGIPFRDLANLHGDDFEQILARHRPDLLISISCPQIIRKRIRDRFPAGCINVHGAPLPRYRGLMPAFWALRNGETTTATTVHELEEKLDDGDIIVQRQVEITANDTWDSLVRKTKKAGAEALVDAVLQLESGTVERRPNLKEEATYFSFPAATDRRVFLAAGRRFF